MGRRIRVNSNNAGTSGTPGNGIMGSGIFGMFGTSVHCKSDDNSLFCLLSKFVNSIIMIIFLISIAYLIYLFVLAPMKNKFIKNRK